MGSKIRLVAGLAAPVIAVVGLIGLGGDSATSAPGVPEAERDAMAQTAHVQGAPKRELVLSRVVVPPGARLALHHHLGTQVARIEAGVLTYTVQQGEQRLEAGCDLHRHPAAGRGAAGNPCRRIAQPGSSASRRSTASRA